MKEWVVATPELIEKKRTVLGEEAKERLKSWGVSDEQVRELVEKIMPQFDYANCPRKVERMARREILVANKRDGSEHAVLPFFMDAMGRGDGQCGDLTRQLLVNGNFQAWLAHVNAGRIIPLVPVYCTGNSRTHFNNNGSNHVFAGIKPRGGALNKMVIVDSSFSVVETLGESKYIVKTSTVNPKSISQDLTETVKIGEFNILNGQEDITVEDSAVLGVSSSGECAYAISLVKNSTTNQLIPVIMIIHEDGDKPYDYFWNSPENGKMASTRYLSEFSKSDQAEIRQMLSSVAKFKYTRDKSRFPIPLDENLKEPGAFIAIKT